MLWPRQVDTRQHLFSGQSWFLWAHSNASVFGRLQEGFLAKPSHRLSQVKSRKACCLAEVQHRCTKQCTKACALNRSGNSEESESQYSEERTPSEDGERHSTVSHKVLLSEVDGNSSIERRIKAKIADICSPQKTGASSRLLRQASQASLAQINSWELKWSFAIWSTRSSKQPATGRLVAAADFHCPIKITDFMTVSWRCVQQTIRRMPCQLHQQLWKIEHVKRDVRFARKHLACQTYECRFLNEAGQQRGLAQSLWPSFLFGWSSCMHDAESSPS